MRSSSALVILAALPAASCDDNASAPSASGSARAPASAAPAVSAAARASAAAPASAAAAPGARVTDAIKTSTCEAKVTPLQHATLLIACGDLAIYADPVKDVSYEGLPKASIVLITDIHGDHHDPEGLEKVRTPDTTLVVPNAVADKLPAGTPNVVVMKNGETQKVRGIGVEAIPMYNLK